MHRHLLTATNTFAALVLVAGSSAFAQDTVPVSQGEAIKAAKERVEPEYPAMAKQLHLEGAVQLEAHIGENG
ncbi:MAG TPA: hypothetical protein VFC21_10530, partial [Bryobacteraceae bacterium]|nr:hypothetical protein [Bryobacteraceae bacterium]